MMEVLNLAGALMEHFLEGSAPFRGEYFLLFGDNYHGTGLKFDPFSEKF